MKIKILLIASAPQNIVYAYASQLQLKERSADFTLLIKKGLENAARDILKNWNIISYETEKINIWEPEILNLLPQLKQSASDGVYYFCPQRYGQGFLNLELLARYLNRSRKYCISSTFRREKVPCPPEADELIANNDFEGMRMLVNDHSQQNNLSLDPIVKKGPFFAKLGLIPACTHKCIFCGLYYNPTNPKEHRANKIPETKEMQWEHYISLIKQLKTMGTQVLCFAYEGEIFLFKYFFKFLELLKEEDMYSEIITNGYLMENKIRKHIIENEVVRVRVSLNAASPATYAKIHTNINSEGFHKVINNIKQLKAERDAQNADFPMIGITFVILRWNHHEINDMLQIAIDLGIDSVSFQPILPTSKNIPEDTYLTEKDMRELNEIANEFPQQSTDNSSLDISIIQNLWKQHITSMPSSVDYSKEYYISNSCYAGWKEIAISSSGDVFACGLCKMSMGNVIDTPLTEIWNSPKYIDIRKKMLAIGKTGKPIPGCDCFHCCSAVIKKKARFRVLSG